MVTERRVEFLLFFPFKCQPKEIHKVGTLMPIDSVWGPKSVASRGQNSELGQQGFLVGHVMGVCQNRRPLKVVASRKRATMENRHKHSNTRESTWGPLFPVGYAMSPKQQSITLMRRAACFMRFAPRFSSGP